jgi:hypothetical protein
VSEAAAQDQGRGAVLVQRVPLAVHVRGQARSELWPIRIGLAAAWGAVGGGAGNRAAGGGAGGGGGGRQPGRQRGHDERREDDAEVRLCQPVQRDRLLGERWDGHRA